MDGIDNLNVVITDDKDALIASGIFTADIPFLKLKDVIERIVKLGDRMESFESKLDRIEDRINEMIAEKQDDLSSILNDLSDIKEKLKIYD